MDYTKPFAVGPTLDESSKGAFPQDEVLVTDARANLTPSQMVERKLVALLRSTQLPISRLQAADPRRGMPA